MKLKIKVHANSSRQKIMKISENFYEIWTKEKPIDSKANRELEKIMKNEVGGEIKIVSGFSSKIKIMEVKD